MRRTLIASAVGVALCGPLWAGDISQTGGMGDDTLSATSTDTTTTTVDIDASGDNRDNDGAAGADGYGTAAANNGSTSTATFSNAFNTSTAVASTELSASVSGVEISGFGNTAGNWGNANSASDRAQTQQLEKDRAARSSGAERTKTYNSTPRTGGTPSSGS